MHHAERIACEWAGTKDVDQIKVVHETKLVENAHITSSSFIIGRNNRYRVALGLDNGEVLLGTLGLELEFRVQSSIPDSLLSLEPGDVAGP